MTARNEVRDPQEVESITETETVRVQPSLLREYAESFIVTVVMAVFGITFIVRSVHVPTGSMENTIYSNDFLLVNKFIFGQPGGLPTGNVPPHRAIKRGDVIVFKYPPNPEQNYVKRVIGLPGETIEMRGTKVFINGKELPENKATAQQDGFDTGKLEVLSTQPAEGATYTVYYGPHGDFFSEMDSPEPETGKPGQAFEVFNEPHYGVRRPFRIPDNCYFAMGDNRDNSADSRFWGPVPRDHIIGRPMFVFVSADQGDTSGSVDPRKFLTHGRWGRVGTLIK